MKKVREFYGGEVKCENAKCCHCGKIHKWDEDTCSVYQGRFLCSDCYNEHYGTCNGCGKLHKYSDMNEEIYCKECEAKRKPSLAQILADAGYEEVLLFENYSYEDAFIGVSEEGRAVYDYSKMIDWLMEKEGFSYEEAVEWIDYNTIRACGYYEGAPIILYKVDEWEEMKHERGENSR